MKTVDSTTGSIVLSGDMEGYGVSEKGKNEWNTLVSSIDMDTQLDKSWSFIDYQLALAGISWNSTESS